MGRLIFVYIVAIIISIIFLVRWWRMTGDIREIRNILSKTDKEPDKLDLSHIISPEKGKDITEVDPSVLRMYKNKLKPNECLVKKKDSIKIEVWDKTKWEEAVSSGLSKDYNLLYENT